MNFATQRRIQGREQEMFQAIGRGRGLLDALKILRELKAAHEEGAWDGMSDSADRAYHLSASVALAAAIACVDDRWEQNRIDVEEASKARADIYAAADADTVTVPVLRA